MKIVGRLPKHDKSRRRRRRRLKSLALLPTLLTLGNLICGFAAIYFGLREMYEFGAGLGGPEASTFADSRWGHYFNSFLSVGAGLVILGMVFDGLDGLVARMTRSTSDFGAQLDSLSDVVTCGVAPAVLTVTFMTKELAGDAIAPSPLSEHFLGRAAWVAAAIYVAFTAIRLARYNVEHSRADFDHRTFRGLPSPGAAAIVVAMIIFQDEYGGIARAIMLFALPLAVLATAFLMVSRIPYRRLDQTYLFGRKPFEQLVFLVAALAIFWVYKAPTLLLGTVLFGLSGPLLWLSRAWRFRHAPPGPPSVDQRTERERDSA